MATFKGVQEKWDSIEKKNSHAKGNQYSFYEWFPHEKIETSKAQCFLQLVKRADLQP